MFQDEDLIFSQIFPSLWKVSCGSKQVAKVSFEDDDVFSIEFVEGRKQTVNSRDEVVDTILDHVNSSKAGIA